jgi:elongator complex protein 3
MWKNGEYAPYDTKTASSVVAGIMKKSPPWVRIQRVQRDIPGQLVIAGVKNSNLRQIAEKELEEAGGACRCIRCREIGRYEGDADPDSARIGMIEYDASGGREAFISFDTEHGALIGFARLRAPSKDDRTPFIPEGTALLRELKVLGPLVPIGSRRARDWQHKGFGRRLLAEAEGIAHDDWGMRSIAVNSGIGVRDYYRRHGYGRSGHYMVKALRPGSQ